MKNIKMAQKPTEGEDGDDGTLFSDLQKGDRNQTILPTTRPPPANAGNVVLRDEFPEPFFPVAPGTPHSVASVVEGVEGAFRLRLRDGREGRAIARGVSDPEVADTIRRGLNSDKLEILRLAGTLHMSDGEVDLSNLTVDSNGLISGVSFAWSLPGERESSQFQITNGLLSMLKPQEQEYVPFGLLRYDSSLIRAGITQANFGNLPSITTEQKRMLGPETRKLLTDAIAGRQEGAVKDFRMLIEQTSLVATMYRTLQEAFQGQVTASSGDGAVKLVLETNFSEGLPMPVFRLVLATGSPSKLTG
ncbi:MAG: hypothetical protein UY05_C0069G0005 [Candidatus Peregrinibacteria bacterium GW2011_GWA2_47_7]|nr:MAG: hypothetical protein UY05_C0069G0005 [Candidatus Peregrinibacteria bacterium GW2011_GWA2_47_7]